MAGRRAILAVIALILLTEGAGQGLREAASARSDTLCQRGRLNEFLPDPRRDWNGDGSLDSGDDWIELHNAGSTPWDIGGWKLDDSDAPASSIPYVIPLGTVLPPGAYAVFYGNVTGIDLHRTGDTVRLLTPDGSLADLFTYSVGPNGGSYSLTDACVWTMALPPTPGRANGYVKVYLPLVQRDASF